MNEISKCVVHPKNTFHKCGLLQWILIFLHMNNGQADKPAYPHSVSSTFIICFLKRIITTLAMCKYSIFDLISVAEQAGLMYAVWKPQTGYCHSWIKKIDDIFSLPECSWGLFKNNLKVKSNTSIAE